MASKFALGAGKKLFEKHIDQYTPADPLYETYTDKKGKERRRKRELPPGLSKRDAKILKSVKKRAHHLDKGFSLCGLRFGWTFVIGIIPGAGDVADAALNYLLVVRKARQAELPDWLIHKMLFNNAVSAAVGFVPLVGDIVLAVYKANSRNAALLEEFLRIRGEEFLKQESERIQNPDNVKPGAGREPGEHVPGKVEKKSSGGWFRRRNTKDGKGKSVDKGAQVTPAAASGTKFVENVSSTQDSPKKK
ncbi:hypothetical protein QCA50_006097 [Cerrena zonata]|uniref:Uncharacterized protein n=1 Tax=Cerrena zonata TaxID=2478898 RepID=A0AAW0GIL2_9APHY